MGHVKEKKSTSNNNSLPPEPLSIAEAVNGKEKPSTSDHHRLSKPTSLSNLRDSSSYPEQPLNAEELISQINSRSNINEVSNDTNNNCNNNNNRTTNRPSNHQQLQLQQRPPPSIIARSQQQQQQHQVHFQQQNQPQIENNVDVDEEDIENGEEKKHIRQRPLHRRFISYIRNLWIGARLNAGKDGKREAQLIQLNIQ